MCHEQRSQLSFRREFEARMPKSLFRTLLLALNAIAVLGADAALSQIINSEQQIKEAGECMANLDQSAMDNMQRKVEAFDADFKRLCKVGNRDAALQRAKQFGREMADDLTMKQIKACTVGIKMPIQDYSIRDEKLTENDICKP